MVKQIFQRVPEIPPMFSLLGQYLYSMVFSQGGVKALHKLKPWPKNVSKGSAWRQSTWDSTYAEEPVSASNIQRVRHPLLQRVVQRSPLHHPNTATFFSSTLVKPRQHICATTERVCFALGSNSIKNKTTAQSFGALASQLFLHLHRDNKNKWDKQEWDPAPPTQIFLTCSPLPPCKHT